MNPEIYISVRIPEERKTIWEANKGPCKPCDVKACDDICAALASMGFEILSRGEGRYADAWVKKKEVQ